MSSSPIPCYLVPFSPKYIPQHHILEHPQPLFLPQCERPSFAPIQNIRQNYSCLYLNIYTFGQQTGMHRMMASIPRLQSALSFFINGLSIRQGPSQIFQQFHPFKGYYLSLCFDFVLHSDLETSIQVCRYLLYSFIFSSF